MAGRRTVALLITLATALVVSFALAWLVLRPDDGDGPSDQPAMTLEGVIALVSQEHAGCPEQPAIVLTADAVYKGEGKWAVAYEDYRWTVDEEKRTVTAHGDLLPCKR